jgi:signal transduction histidine kinase
MLDGLVLIVSAAVCYWIGLRAPPRPGLAVFALLVVVLQVTVGIPTDSWVPIFIVTIGVFWAGRQIARRNALIAELDLRTRELESEQDAFARLAVRRERARIAHELHDIVSHHLAVIAVQAGAGRIGAAEDGNAHTRFQSIADAGDQALDELSRRVDLLDDAAAKNDLGPDGMRVLCEQAEAGGLRLDLEPLPPDVAVPATVEEAARRVVQEGLTNAIKHAPGSDVRVALRLTSSELAVEVADSGANGPSALGSTGSQAGIAGMRERVEALGGRLNVGPQTGGGWRLRAELPVAAPTPVG